MQRHPRIPVAAGPGVRNHVFQRRITRQRERPTSITPASGQCRLTLERNHHTRFPCAALMDAQHESVGRYAEPRTPGQGWISNGSPVSTIFSFKKYFS